MAVVPTTKRDQTFWKKQKLNFGKFAKLRKALTDEAFLSVVSIREAKIDKILAFSTAISHFDRYCVQSSRGQFCMAEVTR